VSFRVLGIDPGLERVGWGVVEQNNNILKPLGYSIVKTPAKCDIAERLKSIYIELNEIIKEFEPDEAAIELLYFSKNVKTAISVSEARGVILLTLKLNNMIYTEYQPNFIKQTVSGYGKADKKQIQFAVKTILGLSDIPKPDDSADALAIAICRILSKNFL